MCRPCRTAPKSQFSSAVKIPLAAAPHWMGANMFCKPQAPLPKTQAPDLPVGLHSITGKEKKASAHFCTKTGSHVCTEGESTALYIFY